MLSIKQHATIIMNVMRMMATRPKMTKMMAMTTKMTMTVTMWPMMEAEVRRVVRRCNEHLLQSYIHACCTSSWRVHTTDNKILRFELQTCRKVVSLGHTIYKYGTIGTMLAMPIEVG